MMSGMMSPPPMMMPTIPLYTPAGIVWHNRFLCGCFFNGQGMQHAWYRWKCTLITMNTTQKI
jgi:hypothetical protein